MAKKVKTSPSGGPKKARGRKIKSIEELKQDIASKRLSIKTILETGKLSRLRDLEPLFSKAMADEMGVNHTRFSSKFKNPVDFSIKEIYRFALYIDTDPQLLNKQIGKEISMNGELIMKLRKFKSVDEMKQYSK